MIASYNDGICALSNATLLAYPHPEAPIAITSYASDGGVGACLEQFMNGYWQPLTFFSKQLRDPERNYSTVDRQMLPMYLAIRHFRYLVEGRNFTVFTGHKSLVHAMFKVSDPWTTQQQQQLSFISSFTTDIEHISGKDNVVADCLSRAAISNVSMGIDYTAMAAVQVVSEEIQAYRSAITNLQLADMPVC